MMGSTWFVERVTCSPTASAEEELAAFELAIDGLEPNATGFDMIGLVLAAHGVAGLGGAVLGVDGLNVAKLDVAALRVVEIDGVILSVAVLELV